MNISITVSQADAQPIHYSESRSFSAHSAIEKGCYVCRLSRWDSSKIKSTKPISISITIKAFREKGEELVSAGEWKIPEHTIEIMSSE
jgi:hypothetical protein